MYISGSYKQKSMLLRLTNFRNRLIRNKNCIWRPCLLTDRNEMSNLIRGPSIDASYQVSVHLANRAILVSDKPIFSSPGPKVHWNYCHNLASVVCKLFTFQVSSLKPLAIFIEDLPRMLPTKFRFILQSDFRGEDFLEINQSETRIACGNHLC
jgi:hypothetical protein